ncbi:Trimethyllysine dioxygenase [Tilletiaria anomala UBC 951]|uniref:trimethyllysine dioxygenase n=1 Tax=Tilletiaria anomala (strain ATCC 24038 / CBS 436.72 / UBC 951) TaxID=1037660 RepID=A0A066WP37_TILAU|nr:Trimethyllysine dioxygenase [Tilletiaria anomala UBC 951]KDN52784.1 Trimethyllysine dioxygenase [Tilletiaria anomala UBC 951]
MDEAPRAAAIIRTLSMLARTVHQSIACSAASRATSAARPSLQGQTTAGKQRQLRLLSARSGQQQAPSTASISRRGTAQPKGPEVVNSGISSVSAAQQAAPAPTSTSSQVGSTLGSAPNPVTPQISLVPSPSTSGGKSDRLAIRWASGVESKFHHVWLRDHCRCPACYHPKTKQRLLDTFAIPGNVEPVSMESTTEGLQVEWPPLLQAAENGAVAANAATTHHSLYPWRWLMLNSYSPPFSAVNGPSAHVVGLTAGGMAGLPPIERVLWGRSIGQAPPTVTWDEVMGRKPGTESSKKTETQGSPYTMSSEQADVKAEGSSLDLSVHDEELGNLGLLKWLSKIATFGFCFVSGVPVSPLATEALIRRIAFIRETHYGGFWDFTSNLEHGDTAYTNLKLQAHTDTTYFTDPAGLQMFHLLSHTASECGSAKAEGGESLLVDGFLAAKILRESNETAYATLSEVRLMTHSAGDDDTLIRPLMEESGYPILQHTDDAGGWRHGAKLKMVRYNNDDRSVLRVKEEDVDSFYSALREWNRILTDPEGEYWQQLRPGTALIFDNHRVLHGRSAFVGNRRLCGAYVSHDDYRSKLSVLSARYGDTLRSDSGRKHGRGVWDDGL